jgi:uncharacterized protein (TIGR02594 family)
MSIPRCLGPIVLIFLAVLAFATPAEAKQKKHRHHHHHRVACKVVRHKKVCSPSRSSIRYHVRQPLPEGELQPGPMSKVIELATPYVGLSARSDRTTLIKLMDGVDPMRTAWCVGFANSIMNQAGIDTLDSLAVASYLSWGVPVIDEPRVGDIVILRFNKRRKGPSHLGFLYNITTENGRTIVQVLGGNQNKHVQISNYNANSIVTIRRFGP